MGLLVSLIVADASSVTQQVKTSQSSAGLVGGVVRLNNRSVHFNPQGPTGSACGGVPPFFVPEAMKRADLVTFSPFHDPTGC